MLMTPTMTLVRLSMCMYVCVSRYVFVCATVCVFVYVCAIERDLRLCKATVQRNNTAGDALYFNGCTF